jgi:DNA modification methylase
MELIKKKVSELIPYINNSRTHSEEQITQLISSIKEFGFTNPILLAPDNSIIAGHGRLQAVKRLGHEEVPCIIVHGLTKTQIKALIIADNQLALNAGWDLEKLSVEIEGLKDEDFNIDILGFEDDFIKDLLNKQNQGLTDEDALPEVKENPKSKLGDLFVLGNHRLMCGDATIQTDVEKLMNKSLADLLHTDPPYNVNYSNADRPKASKTDLGKIKNDVMSNDDFYIFLNQSFVTAFTVLKEDSSAYVWHSSAEQINFTKAFVDAGFKFSQQIIWKKPMLLGRGKYQWAHEPCIFGSKGSPYFTDDRTKTTVWDFGGYDKSKNVHPTQKPIFIPEEAINNSSKQGSNVLDLFGGSGSTLIACEKLGRNGFILELDPKYCDVIIQRWQQYTGKEAIHEQTGKTYNSI